MLRVTVELVPHGVGRPQMVGKAVVGQLARTEDGLHQYAACVWDDRLVTTPAVVVAEHNRNDGVWALLRRVLEALADGTPAEGLSQETLDRLARALHDVDDTLPTRDADPAIVEEQAVALLRATGRRRGDRLHVVTHRRASGLDGRSLVEVVTQDGLQAAASAVASMFRWEDANSTRPATDDEPAEPRDVETAVYDDPSTELDQ